MGVPLVVAALFGLTLPRSAAAEPAPMTLAEALHQAEESREDLLIAREQLAQARLARDRAWATLLPQLAVSGTFTHADREVAFGGRVLQRQDSVAGSISASITVLQGGAYADIVEAHHLVQAAELSTQWTELTLAFEVARAYVSAQAALNLVDTSEAALTIAREHLAAMEARGAVGEVLAIDEGRAQLAVVEATEGVTRARNAAANSLDYLALLIGVDPPVAVVSPTTGEASRPSVGDDSTDGRADLQAATREIRAARAAVTEAWLDYLPTVAITGDFRMTQNTGFSGDPASWQILVSLDWVIYDGGLRRANRRERASRLREAELRLQGLDRTARHQLRQARRDLETALATLSTTRQRLELARETRAQVMRRYRSGVADSLELVEADNALLQADLDLVARRLELARAWLSLYQAAGLDPLGRQVDP